MTRNIEREMQLKEALRKREAAENAAAQAIAKSTGNAHTFIAADGCEVTVTPDGKVFHNMADWY